MVYIQKCLTLGYTAEACIFSSFCVKILSILKKKKKKKNYIQYIYIPLYISPFHYLFPCIDSVFIC